MTDQVYRRLAQHLDRLPGGFAAAEDGAELRLLATLFAPEEADLATHLTLEPEPAAVIGRRTGLPPAEAERRLAAMARKGLIFAFYREEGPTLFQAAPWVVGIYEFQVRNQDEAYLEALLAYRRALQGRPAQMNRQIRTIPIGQSVDASLEVLPYERIGELLASQNRFAVTTCLCRHMARLQGGGCDAPLESCLVFGDWADYYVRNGFARAIDRAELAQILARADQANLVLQPSNSKDIAFLCCCCSCCCGVLRRLQAQPRPSEVVLNAFIARHDPDACLDCGTCTQRCPMQALMQVEGDVRFNPDRCIGCGLCVSVCPNDALRLARKPKPAPAVVHADITALWKAESRP